MKACKLKKSMEELERVDTVEYEKLEKTRISVVLDNIRSSHNVGSFFRTSDAFLVEKVYLCGICPIPPNPEIHKTALGATETVKWEHFNKTEDAIKKLKEEGYIICSVEQVHGSITIGELELKKGQKVAIVFGHEVYGVEQNIINESDYCIEIEQKGTKHSLNVSVCGGIILHELNKKQLE